MDKITVKTTFVLLNGKHCAWVLRSSQKLTPCLVFLIVKLKSCAFIQFLAQRTMPFTAEQLNIHKHFQTASVQRYFWPGVLSPTLNRRWCVENKCKKQSKWRAINSLIYPPSLLPFLVVKTNCNIGKESQLFTLSPFLLFVTQYRAQVLEDKYNMKCFYIVALNAFSCFNFSFSPKTL